MTILTHRLSSMSTFPLQYSTITIETFYFRVNQGSHPGSTLHGPPHHATTIQGQAAHAQALAPQPHAQVLWVFNVSSNFFCFQCVK